MRTQRRQSFGAVFFLHFQVDRSTCFLLRCPKKSSGLRTSSIFSTAATRSGRLTRRRRRSHRSPSRTQKLSSSAPTILGGLPVVVPGSVLAHGGHRPLPTTATRSTRFLCHWQRSCRSPGKIGNANTKKTVLWGCLFLHFAGGPVHLFPAAVYS